MKKFPSFKSAPVIKEAEKEHKYSSLVSGEVKAAKKTSKYEEKKAQVRISEDVSFGQRLNFEETKTSTNKSIPVTNNVNEFCNEERNKLKRKQLNYNKKLRETPKEIALWKEFVAFQDELCSVEGIKRKRLTERKIAILKKAIEMNSDSLELILMHLKLTEEIEDSSTLMRLWDRYLKNESEYDPAVYFELTCAYLNFRQKRFLAFDFEQVNEAFKESFKKFQEIDFIIPLYKEYFRFLKRCGYKEMIIAISQGMIEINIEQLNYGEVDMEAYEDQWDCGLMEHVGDKVLRDFDPPSLYLEDKFSNNALDNWLKLETYRDTRFWHPSYSNFDDYSQIIFDDFKDCLLIFKGNRSKILEGIKEIIFEIGNLFHETKAKDFIAWYIEVLKKLLPFYKTDWRFVLKLFQFIDLKDFAEAERFAKKLMSENRDNLDFFLAYGRFIELKGNLEMAEKVYQSLKKRTSVSFDENVFEKLPEITMIPNFDNLSKNELKIQVYNLVRENPGDKYLYMKIIQLIREIDSNLAMEVFNLIDEQQLKLHAMLEEI